MPRRSARRKQQPSKPEDNDKPSPVPAAAKKPTGSKKGKPKVAGTQGSKNQQKKAVNLIHRQTGESPTTPKADENYKEMMPSSQKDFLSPPGSTRKAKQSRPKASTNSVETAKRSAMKTIRRAREMASRYYCLLPPEIAADYRTIIGSLSHDVWKFKGNQSDVFPFNTKNRKRVGLERDEFLILSRDPEMWKKHPANLYCNGNIMNFYHQFTHRGENADHGYIPIRSELITVLREEKISMTENSTLCDMLEHLGENILEASCIDITIDGNGHFSKVWIINPMEAIKRSHFKARSSAETPRAAILCANPIQGFGGDHDPEKIAETLRTLMNHLDSYYRNSGGRAFNKNTVPLKVLRVPQQTTGWTCGYESMILSDLMRQYIITNGPITTDVFENNIELVEQALDHDPSDAIVLRSDLKKIAKALQRSGANGTPIKSPTPSLDGRKRKHRNDTVVAIDSDTPQKTLFLPSAPSADNDLMEPLAKTRSKKHQKDIKQSSSEQLNGRNRRIGKATKGTPDRNIPTSGSDDDPMDDEYLSNAPSKTHYQDTKQSALEQWNGGKRRVGKATKGTPDRDIPTSGSDDDLMDDEYLSNARSKTYYQRSALEQWNGGKRRVGKATKGTPDRDIPTSGSDDDSMDDEHLSKARSKRYHRDTKRSSSEQWNAGKGRVGKATKGKLDQDISTSGSDDDSMDDDSMDDEYLSKARSKKHQKHIKRSSGGKPGVRKTTKVKPKRKTRTTKPKPPQPAAVKLGTSVRDTTLSNREKALMRKQQKQVSEMEHLSGLLSKESRPKEPLELKKVRTRRLAGQHAASIAQIKDDTLRSSTSQLFKLNQRCNAEGSYGDVAMNRNLPTCDFLTLVKDRVSVRPSSSREESRRPEPKLICMGMGPEKLLQFLEYACDHFDDIEFAEDQNSLETKLFGRRGRRISTKKIQNMKTVIAKSQHNLKQFKKLRSTQEQDSPMPDEAKKPVTREVHDPLLDFSDKEDNKENVPTTPQKSP